MSSVRRLYLTELKLTARDPLMLMFVFAFPVISMLIIGGAFGSEPSSAFAGADPSHWYVASYLTSVIAAAGLLMVPIQLAGYRERGVMRRFQIAGFPRWSFALAQLAAGLTVIAVSCAVLLAVAAPVYGIPQLHAPARVLPAVLAGSVLFVALGVLLGSVLPSARAAQAVGLVLFFPSFLLGAGGPPPNVQGPVLRSIANVLPLTRVTDAIRGPWLGIGSATGSLVLIAALAVAATVLAARRTAL